MLLNIDSLDKDLFEGVKQFEKELNLSFGKEGLILTAKQGENLKVTSDGKCADIEYSSKSEFFRGLAYIVKNEYKPFTISQKRKYEEFSIHHATTRSAFNLNTVKWFLRRLALMGYNAYYLYMQSNYEVDGEPFFGYGEPKYTKAELKEIAAYGDLLGVTVIPCLELLAHQPTLPQWRRFHEVIDIDDVFNVGKEATYELIEKLIATCEECFTTDKIHLGLDEAHYLGHGNYFRENGLKPRIELFLNHLQRLVDISNKHGFTKQAMWSDMLYTEFNDYYYWGNNQLPDEVIARIPESVTLVYWDYYNTDNNHYEVCMKNHLATGRKVIFAGAVWTWEGMLAHNRWSIKIIDLGLSYADKTGVENVMLTSWGEPIAYTLPSMCHAAASAYGSDDEKSFFKTACGCDFDDFMKLDIANYITDDQCFVYSYADETLYNDYFTGLFDFSVREECKDIWKKHIKDLKKAKTKSKLYSFAFNKMIALSEICDLKYTLGIETRRAYAAGDKDALKQLIITRYKPLVKKYERYHSAREKEWYTLFKPEQFEVQDIYIGGMIMRTKHCIKVLEEYIEGRRENIHELEIPLLDLKDRGARFKNIYSRNL